MKKIAIIGAGFSGAYLAYRLKDKFQITVFEKARGVGGRLSTRYGEQGEFDFGAPSFKATDDDFKEFVEKLCLEGLLEKWGGRDEYVSVPRMNQWIKFLLKGVDVKTNTCIDNVEYMGNKWHLTPEFDDYDILISTAPIAQTQLLLLDKVSFTSQIQDLALQPCYVLMIGLLSSVVLPNQQFLQINDGFIEKIVFNHTKPQRPSMQALVIYTDVQWSIRHLEEDLESVKNQILEKFCQVLNIESSMVSSSSLHRWRYAFGTSNLTQPLLLWDDHRQCGASGDWCFDGTVESAFLATNQLIQAMNQ